MQPKLVKSRTSNAEKTKEIVWNAAIVKPKAEEAGATVSNH